MTTPNTTVTKVVLEPGMKIALDRNGVPLTREQLDDGRLAVTRSGDSLMVTMPDGSQTELVDFFITEDVTLEGDFWDLPADSGLVQTAGGVIAQPVALAQAADKGVLGEEAIATDANAAADITEGVAEVVADTAPAFSDDDFAFDFAGLALLGLSGGTAVATDAAGNVTDVNEAPTANGEIAAQTAVKDRATWSLDLAGYFADADAEDTRSYALTAGTLPEGLVLDAATGIISGTPTTAVESSSYTFTMTDSGGLSTTQSFELVVVDAPAVQSFTVADATGTTTLGKSGEALTFVVTLSEAVTSTDALSAVFTVNGQDVTATSEAVTTASNTITAPVQAEELGQQPS